MARSTEEPVVSIIVPVYKVEKYLHKCVDSIINQTYRNLEIILVDDGSPDRCPQICDEYKEKDDRILAIHKNNGGLSDARNAGLNAATGEYITFIDSDDWYENKAIEYLMKGAHETNADIACIGLFTISDDSMPLKDLRHTPGTLSSAKYLPLMCGKQRSESVCDKLFKSSLIDDILFEPGRLNEDFLFLSKVLLKDCNICCVNYWGYNYFKRNGSITHSNLNSVSDGITNALVLKEKAKDLGNQTAERAFAQAALFQARTMLLLLPEKDIMEHKERYEDASKTIRKLFLYIFVPSEVMELKYRLQVLCLRMLPRKGLIYVKKMLDGRGK